MSESRSCIDLEMISRYWAAGPIASAARRQLVMFAGCWWREIGSSGAAPRLGV